MYYRAQAAHEAEQGKHVAEHKEGTRNCIEPGDFFVLIQVQLTLTAHSCY
jgi:hypothetical protein